MNSLSEEEADPPEGAPIEEPEAKEPQPDNLYPGEHFPETRIRQLSEAEVSTWEYKRVRYAINEIFARHGAEFKTDYIRKQFETMSWYKPVPGRSAQNMTGFLTGVERKNLSLLGARRKQLEKLGAK